MPFKPGQSGNPGGRKRTLTGAVRKVCGQDGAKLVAAFALIALGKSKDIEKKFGAAPTIKDRISALGELADRGFGKPQQNVELTGKDGGPVQTARVEFVDVS